MNFADLAEAPWQRTWWSSKTTLKVLSFMHNLDNMKEVGLHPVILGDDIDDALGNPGPGLL